MRSKRFIAIGASGSHGLRDIVALLAALPEPLEAVVMVVLHRPVGAVSHLREVLSRATAAPVRIAGQHESLEAGRIYIGEPARHLELLSGSRSGLVGGGHEEYRNRTIDLLFVSLAEHAGADAIGIVLSGALDDGARGLAAIQEAGGLTMVLTPTGTMQDRGMPQSAIGYDGTIKFVGSAAEIARRISTILTAAP